MNDRNIIPVFAAALLVRLAYVLVVSPEPIVGDSNSWIAPAAGMIEGRGYGESHRPPAYPATIAVLYAVFGQKPEAITVFQSFIGALTCVSVYLTGKLIFSSSAGLTAALLAAFYPYLIFYTGTVISETLLAFLISGSILCVLWARDSGRVYRWAAGGAVLGLASLCKPVTLVFLPVVCLWAVMYSKTGERLKSVKNIAVYCVFWAAVIAPWTARNYAHYGDFILISPGASDFWLSNNDVAMCLETSPDLDTPAPENWVWFPKERYAQINALPRKEAEKVFWRESTAWIKQNPQKFLWLVQKRLLHLWRLWPKMATRTNKLIAGLTSGVYFPLAFLGAILALRKSVYAEKAVFLLLIFAVYTLAYLFFFCMIRYRVPIDPLVLIFTGYCVTELLTFAGKKGATASG